MNQELLKLLHGDSGEEHLSRQLNISKFKSYAREKFLDYVKYDAQYLDLLKYSAKHSAYNLPATIDEFFIREDSAPYFWILDSNILQKAEESFRSGSKSILTAGGNYSEIKKFYLKWLTQTNEKEKQYFALSTINLIERNINGNNFLKYLLNACIFSYDKRINSPEKAESLLVQSLQLLDNSSFSEEQKDEFYYLINLYYGFFALRSGNVEAANIKFGTAQSYKSNGITAIFYNALAEKILGNIGNAQTLLTKVIQYDKNRFNFAIENNNLSLFAFFFQNSNIYNIFSELRFADMLPEIEMVLAAELTDESKLLYRLQLVINNLKELRISKYYNENVNIQLQFIDKYLLHFKENKNVLNYFTGELLLLKFKNIIDQIANIIKSNYSESIESQLSIYDYSITESKETINALRKDIEEMKVKIKKSLEITNERITQHHNQAITNLEYKIENIEQIKRYDPASAFSNAMIFNAVISILIFIIGGFMSGFLNNVHSTSSMSEIFAEVVVSGTKWGGVCFLLGLIFAFFSSASAIWERTNIKSKFQRDIQFLKNHKEREIVQVKIESERKAKAFQNSYENRIKELENKIENLQNEKNSKLADLSTASQVDIDKLIDKLNSTFAE